MKTIFQIALGDHHRSQMDTVKEWALSRGYGYELITDAPKDIHDLPLRVQSDIIRIGILAHNPYHCYLDTDCAIVADEIPFAEDIIFFNPLIDCAMYNGADTEFFEKLEKRLAGVAENGMVYHAILEVFKKDFDEFFTTLTQEERSVIGYNEWFERISPYASWFKYDLVEHSGETLNMTEEKKEEIILAIIEKKASMQGLTK